ncbi:hypothetical protein F8C00_21235 [Escherichia coli]|nr:hypothetical protein [Escherichia coli]
MFAGKKSAQIREILISESAWEEMTCLFAPSLAVSNIGLNKFSVYMGCREQEIVELLNGSVSLTKAMALRLSHVVGGSWSKWMLIQEQFELQLAQREIKELMILTNIGDEVVGL